MGSIKDISSLTAWRPVLGRRKRVWEAKSLFWPKSDDSTPGTYLALLGRDWAPAIHPIQWLEKNNWGVIAADI